ncbi:hypothetical protein GIB67_039590 [Kingdonia uniflora]|uniref:Proteinase inhibitor n=1 Tax=Kingdonia uniflora TaxID=39325 RepID=A0A7J7P6Y7_9MAGN|nr:hypothetical protein GIB67_039590 [Kingdonia uniflora]
MKLFFGIPTRNPSVYINPHHTLKQYHRRAKMAFICEGKNSWPELVGADGDVAAATIECENSNVNAIVVLEGTSVPLDFRCDRVWVWVNDEEEVVKEPKIG